MAIPYAILHALGLSTDSVWRVLRLLGVPIGAAWIYFVYQLSITFFRSEKRAIAATALVALIPGAAYTAGVVNNDVLIALLFKETPLVLIGIVPFMCLYRWVPWIKVTGSYAAIAAVLVILRGLFVPQASNPEWLGAYTFYKLLSFVHLLTAELLANWEVWEVVAMATLIGLFFLLRRLRVPTLYTIIACVVWPFIIAALLTADHNPALVTIPLEFQIQLRLLAVDSGCLIAIVTAGGEPALVFVIGHFAVGVANVNRVGPHYWYYTAMMWGLVDGAVLNAGINLLRGWRRRELKVEEE
jgi:hypothetical protein